MEAGEAKEVGKSSRIWQLRGGKEEKRTGMLFVSKLWEEDAGLPKSIGGCSTRTTPSA
jgi:hypothetical protein